MGTVLSYVVAFALGVVASVVAAIVLKRWDESRRSRRIRDAGKDALSYDPTIDGWFRVVGWSAHRMLTRGRLNVIMSPRSDRPRQRWIPEDEWNRHCEHFGAGSAVGPCGYITDCSGVDWREGAATQNFSVTVSPCDYSEGLATWAALRDNEEAQKRVVEALREDPLEFIRSAPPQPLGVSIGVLSHDGRRFLALRRSATVATARNIWTMGPYETMALPDESAGSRPEDFFNITERGLLEELGLNTDDYSHRVCVSWFGYFAADAHPWVFAQVRVSIADELVLEKRKNCHSTDEASEARWMPFDRDTIEAIIRGQRVRRPMAPPGPNGELAPPQPFVIVRSSVAEGRWIAHAPHAANELWRMQGAL